MGILVAFAVLLKVFVGLWLSVKLIQFVIYVCESNAKSKKPPELTSHQRFVIGELERMNKGLPDPHSSDDY